MNLDELAMIEQAASFRFADDLRDLYLQYPFGSGSWARDYAMPDDIELLLKLNGPAAALNAPSIANRNLLQIGSDGGESLYFAESVGAVTRILAFELETGALVLRWESLDAWRAHLEQIDRDNAEDEALSNSRPWWKFWR